MGIVNRSTKIVIDRVYFPRPHVENIIGTNSKMPMLIGTIANLQIC